jgi:hypothetical protein
MLFSSQAIALDASEVVKDVQWWGGGLNTLAPGCSNPEACVGSIAFKFETLGQRVRVFVFANPGTKEYDAYSRNKRYPGDTKFRSSEPMWVEIDGVHFSFRNSSVWSCSLLNPMRIDCTMKPQGGRSYVFTVQPLPPGPSPSMWPE